MSTAKPLYGTSGVAITCTLASLAAASYRQSAVVDNTTNLFEDALVQVTLKTTASAGATLSVYVYATDDGGTTYSNGASGSDAAFTPGTNDAANMKLLFTFVVGATQQYVSPLLSVAALFGGRLPAKWGLIVFNNSGQALDATAGNHKLQYQGVNTQIV